MKLPVRRLSHQKLSITMESIKLARAYTDIAPFSRTQDKRTVAGASALAFKGPLTESRLRLKTVLKAYCLLGNPKRLNIGSGGAREQLNVSWYVSR